MSGSHVITVPNTQGSGTKLSILRDTVSLNPEDHSCPDVHENEEVSDLTAFRVATMSASRIAHKLVLETLDQEVNETLLTDFDRMSGPENGGAGSKLIRLCRYIQEDVWPDIESAGADPTNFVYTVDPEDMRHFKVGAPDMVSANLFTVLILDSHLERCVEPFIMYCHQRGVFLCPRRGKRDWRAAFAKPENAMVVRDLWKKVLFRSIILTVALGDQATSLLDRMAFEDFPANNYDDTSENSGSKTAVLIEPTLVSAPSVPRLDGMVRDLARQYIYYLDEWSGEQGDDVPNLAGSLLDYRLPAVELSSVFRLIMNHYGSSACEAYADGCQCRECIAARGTIDDVLDRLQSAMDNDGDWKGLVESMRNSIDGDDGEHEWGAIYRVMILSRTIHRMSRHLSHFVVADDGPVVIGDRDQGKGLGRRSEGKSKVAGNVTTIPDCFVVDGIDPAVLRSERVRFKLDPSSKVMKENVVGVWKDFERWGRDTVWNCEGSEVTNHQVMACLKMIGWTFVSRRDKYSTRYICDNEINNQLLLLGIERDVWDFVYDQILSEYNNKLKDMQSQKGGIRASVLVRSARLAARDLMERYQADAGKTDVGKEGSLIPFSKIKVMLGELKFGNFSNADRLVSDAVEKELHRHWVMMLMVFGSTRRIGQSMENWVAELIGFFVMTEDSWLDVDSKVQHVGTGVTKDNFFEFSVQNLGVGARWQGFGYYRYLVDRLSDLESFVSSYLWRLKWVDSVNDGQHDGSQGQMTL